jgi:hypothetical protein
MQRSFARVVILGAWRVPGALALLVPRFPRLKEWAYAGAFFSYTGAAASHLLARDTGQWPAQLIFSVFTLVSWALRPVFFVPRTLVRTWGTRPVL